MHIQLIVSFNFGLDHQINSPNQLTFDYNRSSVHHYLQPTQNSSHGDGNLEKSWEFISFWAFQVWKVGEIALGVGNSF